MLGLGTRPRSGVSEHEEDVEEQAAAQRRLAAIDVKVDALSLRIRRQAAQLSAHERKAH